MAHERLAPWAEKDVRPMDRPTVEKISATFLLLWVRITKHYLISQK
jgi:hypothetical protein